MRSFLTITEPTVSIAEVAPSILAWTTSPPFGLVKSPMFGTANEKAAATILKLNYVCLEAR
ncbi:hypothetical protein HRbin02_00113 [Candidatus Calditenuaceae archaeon HR02]|nr:hypothetical protein HRbin02_00113 [Candidatus Calditenuaceae archaeon HR02]